MKVTKTEIPGVLILEPAVFADERGFFFESFNRKVAELTGFSEVFVQDNHSHSKRNVLRGLHYQLPPNAQGKVVRVVTGEIFDVAVDIRRSSPTFGRSVSAHLSAENRKMMWMPPGFAHGFLVLSESADCLYKASAYYDPQGERTIVWNDADLQIEWPFQQEPILSSKDAAGSIFRHAQVFE